MKKNCHKNSSFGRVNSHLKYGSVRLSIYLFGRQSGKTRSYRWAWKSKKKRGGTPLKQQVGGFLSVITLTVSPLCVWKRFRCVLPSIFFSFEIRFCTALSIYLFGRQNIKTRSYRWTWKSGGKRGIFTPRVAGEYLQKSAFSLHYIQKNPVFQDRIQKRQCASAVPEKTFSNLQKQTVSDKFTQLW